MDDNVDNFGFDTNLSLIWQNRQEKVTTPPWTNRWLPHAAHMARSGLEDSMNTLRYHGADFNNAQSQSNKHAVPPECGSSFALSVQSLPELTIGWPVTGCESQNHSHLDYGSNLFSTIYDKPLPPPPPPPPAPVIYEGHQYLRTVPRPCSPSAKRPKKPGKNIVKCSFQECGKTFNRKVDFYRHFNGAHAAEHMKKSFWCPIVGCDRSDMEGSRAFPRNDKVGSHLRQAHHMSYQDARMLMRMP